ncbi:MAG: cyclic nucleotide-binding domain-containing protein [Oscillochloris sp.]|nr:cyclic nucleotide-binding domain-containing protein [Oscillochloris sp.]
MLNANELAQLDLFADLTDDELNWVITAGSEEFLEPGEYFIRENEPADRFYVTLAGELQIIRSIDGNEAVMGTTPRGIMGGELAILNGTTSMVTARALVPSRLLVFGLAAFRQMFAAAPPMGTKVLQIATQRLQGYASLRKQQEKLAALGKLSAGLAHELNNPAAAARRAAGTLRENLPDFTIRALQLCKLGLSENHLDRLGAYQQQVIARINDLPPLSTLERADCEDEVGDWLDAQGAAKPYEMASTLVGAGVTVAELKGLIADLPAAAIAATLLWVCEALAADSLLAEIEASSRRIADLVGAVKSYSYMDQAPVQDVVINRDLETTLTVMNHKLKRGVTVLREYDPTLPKITGRGGELNQVWTNLIANAIEAMQYKGTLKVITRHEHDFVMVEIADSGPGIPEAIVAHIFEPFFTTKGVGEGTGLGLDICYRIIKQHHGNIEVQSQPGNTRFIIRLPVNQVPQPIG